MNKRLFVVPALIVLLLLTAFSAEAHRLKREWKRSFDVSDGVTFRLKNKNGGITVESWENGRIEVVARIKVKASSKSKALKLAEKLDFEVEGSQDEVSIEVDYPRIRFTRFLNIFRGDRSSITVSFDVKVPENCNLKIENVNGGIRVSGISGEIALETVNGAIDINGLEIFGKARTVNGAVSCIIGRFPHGADLYLKGVNGSIRLQLPRELNARIDAKSINGGVRVKFPFSGEVEVKRWRVAGTIGDGSGNIKLRTINGGIKVVPLNTAI